MKNEPTFQQLFLEAKRLLNQGVNVIPVRMVAQGKMKEKTPLCEWHKYQHEKIDINKVYSIMDSAAVPIGIAMVTGAISNNLEVIDLDDKHYPTSAMRYVNGLNENYPEIYEKLRIEKTINHGLHIPYFISDGIPNKNLTLAQRINPETNKPVCFIETRGEGGLCVVPPTPNYSFLKECDIPTLTQYERDILINFARLFNEYHKPEKKYITKTVATRNYSVNPFEDFNSTPEAELVLLNNGWEIERENGSYIHYKKPGKKVGNSASFIKETRLFHVFTTSTQLEGDKTYSPSMVLCELQFNGDTKECFKWLIENGYGQFTTTYEKKLIEKHIVTGKPLPNNVSDKGKLEFIEAKKSYQNKYPFGVFWEQNDDDESKYKINRSLIIDVANALGFKLYNGNVVSVDEKFITYADDRFLIDSLKSYIKEDEDTAKLIHDKFEDYCQKSLKYLKSRLDPLDEEMILNDTRNVAYKCFQNCVLKITANDVEQLDYSQIDKLIFASEIINDTYEGISEQGLFLDFIGKAILPNEHLKKYIGYLLHSYKDTSQGYLILLTETVPDPKNGGGSGKNVFSELVGRFTSYVEVNASQLKMTDEFFQPWNGERLYIVSDLPPTFDFKFTKNMLSNSAIIKHLYKDVKRVDASKLPKIMAQTNYSYDISDGGVRRRVKVIEFTNFFTLQGGVDVHYNGSLFPVDWAENDWQGYYTYMISCIQEYLKFPKLINIKLSDTGWEKMFVQNHGEMTYNFIQENMPLFLGMKTVTKSDYEKIYGDFCNENGVTTNYRKSSIKMNDALEEYCAHFGIAFNKKYSKRFNGHSAPTTCRYFGSSEPAEDSETSDDLPF